ncbi:hypothetical protein WKH54_25675 [Priestia megaterium]|uniref:hypothetical protein n=1 Tax=Priestia megaterium TaxID=1404 RepID=UPI00317AA1E4
MEIIQTAYFENLFEQLSTEEKQSIEQVMKVLQQLRNSEEVEGNFKAEQYELTRTRKLTSVNKFTYVIKVHDNVRLIFRVENDKVYVDSIIYQNSFIDKFLKGGE